MKKYISCYSNACFDAGTLVHTEKGLIAIEQLKIGDLVLSKPNNNPDGELAYKPITHTLKSCDKSPIMAPVDCLNVLCADSQLFWTKECGWVKASELDRNTHTLYCLGEDKQGDEDYPCYCSGFSKQYKRDPFDIGGLYLLATADNNVVVCLQENDIENTVEAYYSLIDIEKGIKEIRSFDEDSDWFHYQSSTRYCEEEIALYKGNKRTAYYGRLLRNVIEWNDEPKPYCNYLYNIELADYHAYFVGNQGYWVK